MPGAKSSRSDSIADMNYISGAISYIAGADADSHSSRIVPRLVDRAASSALPQDRREALTALAKIALESPARQAEIGELSIKVLYAVLEQDKEYDDNIRALLEVLINICGRIDPSNTGAQPGTVLQEIGTSGDVLDREELSSERQVSERILKESAAAAGTNTDAFLGLPNSAVLLLDLLEHTDLYIRCSVIELLTAMVANSRPTVQAAVLEAPQAVARLTDLLSDSAQIVRTNATLLLSAIAEESNEICKIIAFSGVMETVFRSMLKACSNESDLDTENDANGDFGVPDAIESAILIQDGLQLIANLLRGSHSTQTFLRDAGCIQSLGSLFAHVMDNFARIASKFDVFDESTEIDGPARAVGKQQYTSIILAIECVEQLALVGGVDSATNRSLCISSGIFETIQRLCFGVQLFSSRQEYARLQVGAIECASILIRGHEETRRCFATYIKRSNIHFRGTPQTLTLDLVTSSKSPAVRAAASVLLKNSLMSDYVLKLPMTSFLNALVSGKNDPGTRNIGNSPASSGDAALTDIASSVKNTVSGWPGEADGPGVYYCADMLRWVLNSIDGARERMLGAYVMSSGDALLARVARSLGHAVRQNAPPPVRIGLFILLNTWLYRSASAVSAFLSSAMHMPLIVELVVSDRSQRDIVSCHVQGMAAVLLGICLEFIDDECSPHDSGFISGGGGSAVFPRSSISDIIRNRIGITTFTSRLDELRGSQAYAAVKQGKLDETAPRSLLRQRSAMIQATSDLQLGHDLWYDDKFIEIIDDVYEKVRASVMVMIGDQNPSSRSATADSNRSVAVSPGRSKGARNASSSQNVNSPLEYKSSYLNADGQINYGIHSAQDEQNDSEIASYKEIIREQDKSLDVANSQINELRAALNALQNELDSHDTSRMDSSWRQERDALRETNADLSEKVSALECLLSDKEQEFAALTSAYTTLEAEKRDEDSKMHARDVAHVEIAQLRAEKESIRSQYMSEAAAVSRLEDSVRRLECLQKQRSVEFDAVCRERDALRSDATVDSNRAAMAEWRHRAEAAEGLLSLERQTNGHLEHDLEQMRHHVQMTESEKTDCVSENKLLSQQIEAIKSDAARQEASKTREISLMREAFSSAEKVAKDEILSLREQLEESRSLQNCSGDSQSARDNDGVFENLRCDLDSALQQVQDLSAELADVRNSNIQWEKHNDDQQRKLSVALKAADDLDRKLKIAIEDKKRSDAECQRLSEVIRQTGESNARAVSDANAKLADASEAVRKMTDFEQRCNDLERMRSRSAEEMEKLKEELASRAEQAIRLSGQVYEADESRSVAEQRLESALEKVAALESMLEQSKVSSQAGQNEEHRAIREPMRSAEDSSYISSLSEEILRLREELQVLESSRETENELQSTINRLSAENLSIASQLKTSEERLASMFRESEGLQRQVRDLQNRLLSLDEAEESKRVLTNKVIDLQRRIDEMEYAKLVDDASLENQRSSDGTNAEVVAEIARLQADLDEKSMRVIDLEKLLTSSANHERETRKNVADLEKRLSESDALLSVVVEEKNDSQKRLALVEAKLEDSDNELVSWRSRTEQLEADLLRCSSNDSELREKSLTDEIESLKSALATQAQELFSAREECKTLSEQLSGTLGEVEKERGDANRLREKVELSNREVSELKTALSDAARSFRSAAKDLASREELLVEISNEKTRLNGSLQASENALQELEIRSSSTEKRLRGEISGLQAQLTRYDMLPMSVSSNITPTSHDTVEEFHARSTNCLPGTGAVCIDSDTTSMNSAEMAELSELVDRICAKLSQLEKQRQSSVVSLDGNDVANVNDLSKSQHQPNYEREVKSLDGASAHHCEDLFTKLQRVSDELQTERADHNSTRRLSNLRKEELDVLSERVTKLENDLRRSESVLDEEKTSFMETRSTLHQSLSAKSDQLEKALQKLGLLKNEIESISLAKSNLETHKEDSENKLSQAYTELEVARKERTIAEQKSEEAVSSEMKWCKKVTSVENELADERQRRTFLEEELEKCKASYTEDVSFLKSKIQAQHDECNDFKSKYEELKQSSSAEREQNDNRLTELEAELEGQNNAVESAERQLRDLRLSSKEYEEDAEKIILALEHDNAALREKVAQVEEEARKEGRESSATRKTLETEIARLRAATSSFEAEVERLSTIENTLELNLAAAEETATEYRNDSTAARIRISDLEAELANNGEKISKLTRQHQELELRSLKWEEKVADVSAQLRLAEESGTSAATRLSEASESIARLNDVVGERELKIKDLQDDCTHLEEEAGIARSNLRDAEEANVLAQREISSMREWIGDLERKTGELQCMADRFEDVERTLNEALGTNSSLSDLNAELNNKIRALTTKLDEAKEEISSSQADKAAVEKANHSAKEQIAALESRMGEIRDVYGKKMKNLEERSQQALRRSSELEAELAAAEIKVSDIEGTRDKLFACERKLTCAQDDINYQRVKADRAEQELLSARRTITSLEKDLEVARACAEHDAFAELEAEHNELLVYLADLELEHTMLKESTTVVDGTRTVESLPGR